MTGKASVIAIVMCMILPSSARPAHGPEDMAWGGQNQPSVLAPANAADLLLDGQVGVRAGSVESHH